MDLNNQGIDDKNKGIDYKGKLVETGTQDRSTPSKESTNRRFTPELALGQPVSSIDFKDRIFSNIAQQRKLPTYDHVILKDATVRSTFLANLHANNPDTKIAVISKVADFVKLGLNNNISLEGNNFNSEDGILFSKNPDD
jgi:hypothetical protein